MEKSWPKDRVIPPPIICHSKERGRRVKMRVARRTSFDLSTCLARRKKAGTVKVETTSGRKRKRERRGRGRVFSKAVTYKLRGG